MGLHPSTLCQSWRVEDIPDLTGKVAVVTGANSGLGYHIARELGRNGAKVYLVCRDRQRGEEALAKMREEAPHGQFELLIADLASLESIRAVAKELNDRAAAIDILINNAGASLVPKRELTRDGFEMHIGINHLGHFALTGLIMPLLLKSDSPRVVAVSSLLAWIGDLKAPDFVCDPRHYSKWTAYGTSKLANLLFIQELGRRYPKVAAVAAHPGMARTELARQNVLHPLFQSPADGALPILRAATDTSIHSGGYVGPWLAGSRGAPSNFGAVMPPQARTSALCRSLWDASVEATKVKY